MSTHTGSSVQTPAKFANADQVWVYEITSIAEHSSTISAEELQAFSQLQNQCLRTIAGWLNNISEYSFELRLMNSPVTRSVQVFLLVFLRFRNKAVSHSADSMIYRLHLEQLFPEGYCFREVSASRIEAILQPIGMHTCYSIRRKPGTLPAGRFNFQYGKVPFLAPLTTTQSEKQPFNDRIAPSLCIPAIYELQPATIDWYMVFTQLSSTQDQVHIRISLRTEEVSAFERMLGYHYYQLLLDSCQAQGIRSLTEQQFLKGLEKYRHASFLYAINIQVAASHASAAAGVAHSLGAGLIGSDHHFLEVLGTVVPTGTTIQEVWRQGSLFFETFPNSVCGRPHGYGEFLDKSLYVYSEAELSNFFSLPVADKRGMPGMNTRRDNPFQVPVISRQTPKAIIPGYMKGRASGVEKGESLRSAHASHLYRISSEDLVRHTLIVGVPGSGKTNTTLQLVRQIMEHGIPFLMIEPVKGEYYQQLATWEIPGAKKIHRFQLRTPRDGVKKIDKSFLRFNPLIPVPGITVSEHIGLIKSALMAAAPMEGVMPMIFNDFLTQFYIELCGDEALLYDPTFILPAVGASGMATSVSSFGPFAEKFFKDASRFTAAKSNSEVEASIRRRIIAFTSGKLAQIFAPESAENDAALLERNTDIILNEPCCIDLESTGDDGDKALIMAFLLNFLYESRKMRKSHDPDNQLHITFVEEAHRLLKTGGESRGSETPGAAAKSTELFTNLLAEARAKAEGIVIIEQSPGKLPSDAIKFTNLKIMHRLSDTDDREYLGKAMSLQPGQIEFAAVLQCGEAIVFDDQLNKPVLVQMNRFQHHSK
ncbi:ATP-binding protein [Terrimonas sp. NA20]|uniref:ATP-binding protein n=1 Tax=Terrimonas ginsenosidimutans TaxID=2908004 RepID=A0ABS9KK48_9BACT|nr:ATP-binding protein [Terrimonas ginsenosidimutans]MCG2612693.1 ATP-binding protein [Terrimonas ginsenosidimutans]